MRLGSPAVLLHFSPCVCFTPNRSPQILARSSYAQLLIARAVGCIELDSMAVADALGQPLATRRSDMQQGKDSALDAATAAVQAAQQLLANIHADARGSLRGVLEQLENRISLLRGQVGG